MPSARSKRKAKEKANARKRAAAGDVLNPYAAVDDDGKTDDETEDEGAEPVEDVRESGANVAPADEARPNTSGSDGSDETLVGAQDSGAVTSAPTPTLQVDISEPEEPPKTTPREWNYDEMPDVGTPDYLQEDPDEPLTEREIHHKEIETWLSEQKGHHYSLKKSTAEKIVNFVFDMKYDEDRAERMKEVRLIVWRAVVRANFWWTNPDTNEPTGKPAPIAAPTGVYEYSFNIFVACAAERLDRVGRDLPDPEYVQQIEAAIRLFFRRIAYKELTRPLEHLAFLLLVDEEQNRFLTKEAMQSRLRMCFDGVKEMNWSGLGIVKMGEWPTRKTEPPLRAEVVWEDVVKRFEL